MSNHYSAIYNSIYSHVIAKLQTELSSRLTYHSIDHTFDVLEQSQQIAAREDINDDQNLFLLKIAALYHDCGFIFMYAGHEEKGCEIAKNELPGFGLTTEEIEKICGMIMATKIPQSPKNKMEEIICDADLDYLGRDDFDSISNSLYKMKTQASFDIAKCSRKREKADVKKKAIPAPWKNWSKNSFCTSHHSSLLTFNALKKDRDIFIPFKFLRITRKMISF